MSNRKLSSGTIISDKAIALLGELKADITSAVKSPEAARTMTESITRLDEDPVRRKPPSAANKYTDNVQYVDHTPYSDGYADRYNDGWGRTPACK
jgi:hypothetical protein